MIRLNNILNKVGKVCLDKERLNDGVVFTLNMTTFTNQGATKNVVVQTSTLSDTLSEALEKLDKE